MSSSDKTIKERQARRRLKEKKWLTEHGWGSWEAVHTALLKGLVKLVRVESELNQQIQREDKDGTE